MPICEPPHDLPPRPLRALLFSKTPLAWDTWVGALERASLGEPLPAQLKEGVPVLPSMEAGTIEGSTRGGTQV